MPHIRPFRALRYEPDAVGDLALVTSPPYDVIGPDEQRALLARHPRNVVRLDLPADELDDEPDDKYRRAARTFAAWRSDGTFHKDPRPAIYVYEQTYRLPGGDAERTQRGFFARLRLEPFGPGGILPHERTLAAPREDRYKLLRATGANMSPVVVMYEDPAGRAAALLAAIVAAPGPGPVADVDGPRRRPPPPVGRSGRAGRADDGEGTPREAATADPVTELVGLAAAGPLTIADGHHRYETALRYRDERRMSRSCEEDPAVRLRAGPPPRVDRPGPDGPADPSARRRARRRGRGLCSSAPRTAVRRRARRRARTRSRRRSGRPTPRRPGRSRAVRPVDALGRRDPHRAPGGLRGRSCRPVARPSAAST